MATAPRPSGPLKGGRTSSDNTVQPMLPPLGSGSELHLCESCGRGQHVLRPRPRPAISMSTREVLTIQCGHFSNFIGSHWWNLQGAEAWRETTGNKEIDYNCTFRQGLTLHNEETYSPRVIAIDLPGSLRTLKQDGVLYDPPKCDEAPAWEGQVEEHAEKKFEKNEYQNDLDKIDEGQIEASDVDSKCYQFEDTVRVWSDYLNQQLHPRSLLMLPIYHHLDERFEVFPSGLEVLRDKQFQQGLEDRLHFFIEECDHLQGLQLLVDLHNGGFGAVATGIAERLQDEYGSKTLFTVAVTPSLVDIPVTSKLSLHHLLNTALAITQLTEHSSLLLPLSLSSTLWPYPSKPLHLPLIDYTPSLPYHTSALLAACLDTCTAAYRCTTTGETMTTITAGLTATGKKLCSVGLALPVHLPPVSKLSTHLSSSPLSFTSLTPHCHPPHTVWSAAYCCRGYHTESNQILAHSILDDHFKQTMRTSQCRTALLDSPLVVSNPFPNTIIQEHLTENTVSCTTSLSSHSGLRGVPLELLQRLTKANVRLAPSYSNTCLDQDSYTELLSDIQTMADTYRCGSPSECSTDEEN